MQPLFRWILDHTHMLTSKFNIHSLSHLCFIFGANIYVMFGTLQRKKQKTLNRPVSKINDKMRAHALFSRSHLNISFRGIDLFSVTYPGPFFVIKRERNSDVGAILVLFV